MDHAYDFHIQDGPDAELSRMNSFRLGTPVSSSGANSTPTARHSRSHSRNSSVSVPVSLPTSVSTSMNDSPPQSPTRSSIGGAKRNSHHRRRSSVSTRRESADMMGVSLPSIPLSSSDDNINLGDRDSIRRRALMALEGKDAGGSFSVEIPELDATEVNKRTFDFPTKPSFPPGIGAGYTGGLNSLLGSSKRDSIKFMASTPSSELLGTLVEEEEEEEEEAKEVVASPVQDETITMTLPSLPSPPSTRPRPASLNLRPLSLALSSTVQAELPTPTLTPSPRSGLKSLTLPSQGANVGLSSNASTNKRQSLILSPSPSPNSSPVPFQRRPSLNLETDDTAPPAQPTRRSSISYVSTSDGQTMSIYGLPTPEMTPTSSTIDRRRSTSVSSSGSMDLGQLNMQRGRPLSISEQYFLFQAHETLVQRITDLEHALSRSSRSRPASCASDVSSTSSSTTPSEPSDEMLQLIADLKAERDELKKDVDQWRTRVAGLQYQIDINAKRLEIERRDGWIARQRLGLLEVEKSSLERIIVEKTAEVEEVRSRNAAANRDLDETREKVVRLQVDVERMRDVEAECARLRAEVLQERKQREDMEHELEHAGLLNTPRPFNGVIPPAASRTMMHAKSRGLGFRSIDSESSFTDVESDDGHHPPGLKVVEEADEDEDTTDDDDDELARYEDEEDGDDEFAFPTSSSYESVMEFARSATPRLSTDSANSAESAPSLSNSRSPSVSPSPLPSPSEPTHARHASLSKVWSFAAAAAVPTAPHEREEVDRFFGCLEDVDNSPPMDSKLHSVESEKNIFAQALMEDDDDLPPFLLPSDVGQIVASPEMEVCSHSPHTLDVVVEEDEEEDDDEEEEDGSQVDDDSYDHDDEFVGEVDEGGIKFTFNPPPSYFLDSDTDTSTADITMVSTPDSVKKPGLVFEPVDEDEDDVSFTFPQLKSPRISPLPSAIPRLRPSPPSSKYPLQVSTPPKIVSPVPIRANVSPSSFATPPPKRVSTAPTFIPQPSPSAPFKVASFIPQPQRTSSVPRQSAIPVMIPPASTDAVSRSSSVTPRPSAAQEMKSPPAPSPSSPTSSFFSPSLPSLMSPTLAARLSFQTLTNLIPVPSLLWSPRSGGEGFDMNSSESPPSGSDSRDHARTSSMFVNPSEASSPRTSRGRVYVPKEKQLEKLRLRMEEERRRGFPTVGLGLEDEKMYTGELDI